MGVSSVARGIWEGPTNSIDNYWRHGSVGTPLSGTSNSQTWGTNNLIVYVPMPVRQRAIAVKLWFGSGTVGTGNVQMGLYDQPGTQLVETTSVAKITSLDEQVMDITDTTIGPGLYYVALWASVSTDTFFCAQPAAPGPAAYGVRTETNAGGPPATATWAVPQTQAFIPMVGIFLEGTPV
jgi:hypothetical protein